MAYEMVVEGLEIAQNAGADLSNKLHFFAKVDLDEDIILCGAGQPALGVIRETAAIDTPVTVQVTGFAKVIAGAAFNAGVMVASDANGAAVLATSGQFAVGMSMQAAGAANEIVTILIMQYGRVA